MLLDDIPYLDPLLMHLRNDETLKNEFTDKSFFMPHHDLVSAIIDAKNPDCVLPKALWILPGNSTAATQKVGCMSPANHTFTIAIAVKCIRDPFILKKTDNKVSLSGQFMELMQLRKLVKSSVNRFAQKSSENHLARYNDISWAGDQILYPNDEKDVLLATSSEFRVLIYN